ncbi:WAP four-disulfide core domain protein 8-like [Crassostrea virginica]
MRSTLYNKRDIINGFKDISSQGKQVTTMIKASWMCLFLALEVVCVGASRRYGSVAGNEIGSCHPPPQAGNCDGVCPRWYYDVRVGSCRQFTYGCCGGNANNFITRELCENVCRDNISGCPEHCFVDQCAPTCRNFPEAACFRLCGCRAIWIYNGEDVTRRCRN